MEVWRRRGEAVSAGLSAALYSVYHGLYSEVVISSAVSAVALAEVGRFREAVKYVQKAAKALYEAAKEVFEQVKVSLQRLVEPFVEAVTRVLAWVDEHKAYLFLMAAVAAGVIALNIALDMWSLIELDKLAYAASLTPFVTAGVKEYSREEVFNMVKEPDPYEKFKEVAKAANAGRIKLAEPWESLRLLIMPKPSEEKRLMRSKAYSELDEGKKKALFYAVLALEEAFGVYRTALRKYAEEREKAVEKREMGEGPFKWVRYMADLGRLAQLAEKEEAAFGEALRILRERLNEYAVKYGLRDLLDVEEGRSRGLAEAEAQKLSELNDVSFGVKALAALIAYREYALGRKSPYGTAAWHWLEVGGSARLLYYAPWTAYLKAEKAKMERPAAVEELVAEALRRLFLKPGADHHRGFVEELVKSGRLALMLDKETESAYVFRFYSMKESGKLVDLGIELWISKVGKGIVYFLKFEDMERWLGFFKPELEAAVRAAGEVGGRLPVKDRFSYMLGWVDSDVTINRRRNERVLRMTTSHLWQLAETHALFGWSKIVELRMNLTLEGPKLAVTVKTPLERLDKAIRESAEGGWLKMLGINAGSWDGLKRWVVENWDFVVRAAVRRLGEEVRGELEALRDRLNDDKIAREVIAPVLLLIQAEKLGVNETTLRYFGAAASGAIGGDGYVSAAMGVVGLTSGERVIALLWAAALAAHGIETEVRDVGRGFDAVTSGGDAAKLAGLYFLYGSPLLEGDKKVFNYKLDEAVELGAEGLSVSWEGLRRTPSGHVAADLTISVSSATVKYNVYIRETDILLRFNSSDRDYVELAVRLLKLAGVTAEVKREGGRDVWYVYAYTDVLAAAHKELRNAIANIVREAAARRRIDAGKAERWLEKLEGGLTLKEGWPRYNVRLNDGALEVRYETTDPVSIEDEARRFTDMGLKEGEHFSMKKPERGKKGYVSILREGLEHAAWLSEHGSEEQRRLAAEFVKYILERAKEAGDDVSEKATKIVEEGKARGSLRLEGFEGRVEVNGKEHVVKVVGWNAEPEMSKSGKKLLRIWITAEVDGVKSEYTMTFSRRSKNNEAVGRATARADAPGGREADAERFAAMIKALTGEEPWVYRINNGRIMIECGRSHLKGFMRFAELADVIVRWLEETSRR
jgi:hypothetical protein